MQALYYGLPKWLRGKESGKPVIQEMQVRFLGREDLPEKEIATHSSILAWEIPWTEEPGGLQSMGLQRVRYALATNQQQQLKVYIRVARINRRFFFNDIF